MICPALPADAADAADCMCVCAIRMVALALLPPAARRAIGPEKDAGLLGATTAAQAQAPGVAQSNQSIVILGHPSYHTASSELIHGELAASCKPRAGIRLHPVGLSFFAAPRRRAARGKVNPTPLPDWPLVDAFICEIDLY